MGGDAFGCVVRDVSRSPVKRLHQSCCFASLVRLQVSRYKDVLLSLFFKLSRLSAFCYSPYFVGMALPVKKKEKQHVPPSTQQSQLSL